jgi:hypothetical protein
VHACARACADDEQPRHHHEQCVRARLHVCAVCESAPVRVQCELERGTQCICLAVESNQELFVSRWSEKEEVFVWRWSSKKKISLEDICLAVELKILSESGGGAKCRKYLSGGGVKHRLLWTNTLQCLEAWHETGRAESAVSMINREKNGSGAEFRQKTWGGRRVCVRTCVRACVCG